ncbi:MAG: hypothetical protein V4538_01760 [Bacteroidota bacterium]
MSENNNIKYQKQTITIANGAVAGIQTESEITLDVQYPRCTGISIIEKSNTGATTYDIGFKPNPNEVIADYQDRSLWLIPTGVKRDDCFRSFDFAVKGDKASLLISTDAITTAVIKLQVIYRLEK